MRFRRFFCCSNPPSPTKATKSEPCADRRRVRVSCFYRLLQITVFEHSTMTPPFVMMKPSSEGGLFSCDTKETATTFLCFEKVISRSFRCDSSPTRSDPLRVGCFMRFLNRWIRITLIQSRAKRRRRFESTIPTNKRRKIDRILRRLLAFLFIGSFQCPASRRL